MEEDGVPSIEELKKLKVVDLKARLSSLGLQTSGLKADLVARLHSYFLSIQQTQQPGEPEDSEPQEEIHVEHENARAQAEHQNEAMEGDVKEVTVENSVLEHLANMATIVDEAKPCTPTVKKRRRRAGELSARQKALKRLRKDEETGRDSEEIEIIFGKKNWPPPFEDTVILLRYSLMRFSKKTEGWTKEDLAELRSYYTHKWKVLNTHQAMLTRYFKVAALSPRSFIVARQIMDNHKEKHANLGKSVLRQEVKQNLFAFITGICPIDDEEILHEKLKNVAEGKTATGVSSQASTSAQVPGKYEKLKMEYDKLRAEKSKLARINAQLVKTISSLTELLQDRTLTQEAPCYDEPQDVELAEEIVEQDDSTPDDDQLVVESPSFCENKEDFIIEY